MLPYLQIIICAVLWGLAGPLIKWSGLPPLDVIALRMCVPLVLAYAWIRWVDKQRVVPLDRALLFISFTTLLGNVFYISAFQFTSISNVLLLLYTRPVITTIMAGIMLHEHIPNKLWALLALAGGGAMLIVSSHELSFRNRDIIGMVLALTTALVTSFSFALIKRSSRGQYAPSQILFHQHVIGGAIGIFLLPSIFLHSPPFGLSIALLYPATVGFIGSILYFMALRTVPLSRAMPLTYLELGVAIACGILFFGEGLSIKEIVGGVAILVGAAGTLKISYSAARRM